MDEIVLILLLTCIYGTGGWRSAYSYFIENKRFILHEMDNIAEILGRSDCLVVSVA